MDELSQRIRYLVEHGGLWDDPLAEVRSLARIAVGLAACALVLHLIDILLR